MNLTNLSCQAGIFPVHVPEYWEPGGVRPGQPSGTFKFSPVQDIFRNFRKPQFFGLIWSIRNVWFCANFAQKSCSWQTLGSTNLILLFFLQQLFSPKNPNLTVLYFNLFNSAWFPRPPLSCLCLIVPTSLPPGCILSVCCPSPVWKHSVG